MTNKPTIALYFACPIFAQNEKPRVAVFDPVFHNAVTIDNNIKESIREIIISTIVNLGEYNIVERTLLSRILEEQDFSNSGIVDDENAIEIGKLAGASKVILSLVSPTASTGFQIKKPKNILTIKIIDVKTASIEKQQMRMITNVDFFDVTTALTKEVTGHGNVVSQPTQSDEPVESKKTKETKFRLYLAPGYIPENVLHKDFPIEVLIDGKYAGKGTLSAGFDIDLKDNKPKRSRLEFHPTSVSDNGDVNTKYGITIFNIDTHIQSLFEFEIQSRQKGKWTIYTVVRK